MKSFCYPVVLELGFSQSCYNSHAKVETLVKTPQPWEYMKNEELPKSYDPYNRAE